jgi:hypothetical protein
MKVICINDTPTKYPLGPDGPENILITKGKTYDVLNLTLLNDYVILCDDGNANSMGRTRFISLEEFREGQLNKIL